MLTRITILTVVVEDQEHALKWYTEKLGFNKKMDSTMEGGMRWITVAPPAQENLEITLADWRWYGNRSRDRIGKNPTVVMESTDCNVDYEELTNRGVRFTSAPSNEPWGVSAVFVDLYGNPYNIVERAPPGQ